MPIGLGSRLLGLTEPGEELAVGSELVLRLGPDAGGRGGGRGRDAAPAVRSGGGASDSTATARARLAGRHLDRDRLGWPLVLDLSVHSVQAWSAAYRSSISSSFERGIARRNESRVAMAAVVWSTASSVSRSPSHPTSTSPSSTRIGGLVGINDGACRSRCSASREAANG